ncbi:hypothetical protein BDN72DRAFT_872079 [Pluteus cervinus]|uniref:Uncharacterized protein n=1 Tax=Pluteus cervinus TaxID=181527 RepID=A0ACD3AFI4_9AGAR|nr:hypothetical protein BDN72DRAFT_872079 [Pluteus cervinus]
MYYDKRFQTDLQFPFVTFSHLQVKLSTTGGFLLAKRNQFDGISERLLNIKEETLKDLINRMSSGEYVKAVTDAEKDCFKIIHDLDHINGRVYGSTTSKKYMRNEIWSLVAARGAPSWYITISPTDIKHPIALYYADTKEKFIPEVKEYADKFRLISHNPVASARFFHFMISLFIKHLLGIGSYQTGIYGPTAAYYVSFVRN